MSPSTPSSASIRHIWWRDVPYSPAERLWDAVVHAIGIAVTVIAGGTLLVVATAITAPEFAPAIALYVGALATVFVVSLIFNMTRVDSIKRLFARLDQAAIFLLIAGTYTPILSVLTGTPIGNTHAGCGLGRCPHWGCAQADRPASLRPACAAPLPGHRLERHYCFQDPKRGAASKHALAATRRRHGLLFRDHFSRVGAPAVSQRHVALLRRVGRQPSPLGSAGLHGPAETVVRAE